MPGVRTLKAIALSLLKARVRDILDVGGLQYLMVRELLLHPAVTSQQLGVIEENSPHLWPETEEVWKELSIRAFIEIRIAVEDGKQIAVQDGWRALHREEEAKQTAKLLQLEAKLRDSRKAYDSGRATSKAVDGLRIEKRRKIASSSSFNFSAKPKSLFEKARASGRRIASMHAPPRIPQAPTARASLLMSHSMPSKPPPPIVQTTRLVKVPRSELPPSPGPSSGRPIAPLPSRSPILPMPRALASSPSPLPGRCGPTKNSSIFLPKKR